MKKETILLPVAAAAEEFGVNRQTIINWHNDGLLQGTTIKGNRFVTRKSLDKLKSLYPSAGLDANKLDNYRYQIAVLQAELEQMKDALRRERIYRHFAPRYVNIFVERFIQLMRSMNRFYVKDEKQEKDFIRCWLFGHDIQETCKSYNVSCFQYQTTVKKYSELLREMVSYAEMIERNRELEVENMKLRKENQRLRDDMEEYRSRSVAVDNEESWKDKYSILTKDIIELDLTVRAMTILRAHNFKNLSQVIKHSKRELLKLRNLGNKVIVEIEDLLEPYGLSIGMDLSSIPLKDIED